MRQRHRSIALAGFVVLTMVRCALAQDSSRDSFVTFETGQVRPLALSADGARLFAVNTPDAHLEIFDVGEAGLARRASVPVGMEPVAVAVRSDAEVWVVNHLSDSVSVVDVAADPPRVVRTLQVGDEPRDLVFAGPGRRRAFVTTAHRGQNRPGDPQLTTPGIGRADVWVFDADDAAAAPTILTLFGDTPRALAVTPDGATVYAAVFHSGNQTTTVTEGAVCNGGPTVPACLVDGAPVPGGLPPPRTNVEGINAPETGLIVKFDPATGAWQDPIGRDWRNALRFSLPDLDVFAIDAMATPPAVVASFPHVGTILFNMIVNPISGALYVSNTEARNEVRFEGPGVFGGSTVRGHLHEARITVIDDAGVRSRHLNHHIDYGVVPSPAGTKERSLATPLGMAVDAAGTTLWLAAFGSSTVAALDTATLAADTRIPDTAEQIPVSGGGPSGLALDEARGRLYVLTRFDNAVKVIDTAMRREVAGHALHDAEPDAVRDGRPVLYDARLTSSNGEASCASCHVFGDFDSLAWDLGNPDDVYAINPNPIRLLFGNPDFHPMKGPMTTQSLRGLAGHGPMHWRGDRTGGTAGGDPLDEAAAFRTFIVAFDGLLGNGDEISETDMERFTSFILEVTYPPNPVRSLDNRPSAAAAAGNQTYFGRTTDVVTNCNGCHVLDPARGFFGTDGFTTFENEPQDFKIAHLRNLYQKVGMFGMPAVPFIRAGNNAFLGDQVRGFGFLHDGSIDTLVRFHQATVFDLTAAEARELEQFMFEFPSNLAPAVGQQETIADAGATARLDLLRARHAAGECDVVVKGVLDGLARGGHRLTDGRFQLDRASEVVAEAALVARAAEAGQALTFTCVPFGAGVRAGVDRDGDGAFDRDELDGGMPPDMPPPDMPPPGSTTTTLPPPQRPRPILVPGKLLLRDRRPAKRMMHFRSKTSSKTPMTPPAPGSADDPTAGGGALRVHNAARRTTDDVTVDLPAEGWKAIRRRGRFAGWRWKPRRRDGHPVRALLVSGAGLVVRAGGPRWPYTLDEPAQEAVAVRVRLGDPAQAAPYCAVADRRGAAPGRGADAVGRFRAESPAPQACPEPSGHAAGR